MIELFCVVFTVGEAFLGVLVDKLIDTHTWGCETTMSENDRRDPPLGCLAIAVYLNRPTTPPFRLNEWSSGGK